MPNKPFDPFSHIVKKMKETSPEVLQDVLSAHCAELVVERTSSLVRVWLRDVFRNANTPEILRVSAVSTLTLLIIEYPWNHVVKKTGDEKDRQKVHRAQIDIFVEAKATELRFFLAQVGSGDEK